MLGIDYGARTIGLALSDEGAVLARPWKEVRNSRRLIATISDAVRQEKIGEVIVGLPLPMKGQDRTFVREVERFIRRLRATVPATIVAFNETLTTRRARQRLAEAAAPRRVSEHAAAAAEFLQNYLDRQQNKRRGK